MSHQRPQPARWITQLLGLYLNHRVLEILVNLLSKLIRSLEDWDPENKWVAIWGELRETDRFCIFVEYNGVGIKVENMKKIFIHGFTTKKNGHGSGLRNCANAAKEMGGTLG